ncbi:hypothetical protein L1987_30804 [Smallanthus sonchifolius]|uniref:Uncharacterized protein n=1 Tax=Smallanthus sonchifolius TaxID=185202 RepID=A0ACB9I4Q8_9ASTR|nr:hypothetical protein L1987_30804 [Smallanthus sonchifolius]
MVKIGMMVDDALSVIDHLGWKRCHTHLSVTGLAKVLLQFGISVKKLKLLRVCLVRLLYTVSDKKKAVINCKCEQCKSNCKLRVSGIHLLQAQQSIWKYAIGYISIVNFVNTFKDFKIISLQKGLVVVHVLQISNNQQKQLISCRSLMASVQTLKEIADCLEQGSLSRTTMSTNMNNQSRKT